MSVLYIKDKNGNFIPVLTIKGADGKSAYQAAQEGGYTGTEAEFAARLAVPFVTPQMFGAAGDGVTDDTEAFRSAAATGHVLYIPEGSYYLSGTISYNGLERVKIICDGSIYMESQETEISLFNIMACENVEIVGLKVESTRDKTGVAPEGHVRVDYSSSNVMPLYILDCGYVAVRNCTFVNPATGFMIRGVLDDDAEVRTKAVIDNVSIENACMGCFVDRLLEFNITNSSFYMASGLGVGDHAIYAARYIKKVNIDSCYFWSGEADTTMGPLVEFGAYEKCIQNACISNCVFSTRIAFDIRGNGKYTISDCISKTFSYFTRPSGGVDVSIINCQIEAAGEEGVISPAGNDNAQYIAPMNIFVSNSLIHAVHLYNFEAPEGTEIHITANDCEIETTDLAVYSSAATVCFRFINSRFTVAGEVSFARYFHTNEMEFVGCKFVSAKGLFYCDPDIGENKIVLINCFLEAPSLYRSTEPTNKATCYNSYLNGELMDRPYVTGDELSAAVEDALAQAKESGEFDGEKGDPGPAYTLTDDDKASIASAVKASLTTESWTFTLEDGSAVTKAVYVG